MFLKLCKGSCDANRVPFSERDATQIADRINEVAHQFALRCLHANNSKSYIERKFLKITVFSVAA